MSRFTRVEDRIKEKKEESNLRKYRKERFDRFSDSGITDRTSNNDFCIGYDKPGNDCPPGY